MLNLLKNIFSNIPLLSNLTDIIFGWFIGRVLDKKFGDYGKSLEELHKTENRLKAFRNALTLSGVPIQKLLPIVHLPKVGILLRQKPDNTSTKDQLAKFGWKYVDKSMGLYVLPPQQTKNLGVYNFSKLREHLSKFFNQNSSSVVKLAVLVDYNRIFAYKSQNANSETVMDFIRYELDTYVITTNGVLLTLDEAMKFLEKRGKAVTAKVIMSKCPIQYLFANELDDNGFELLKQKETDILQDIAIKTDDMFLELSRLNADKFTKIMEKNVPQISGWTERVKRAQEQAEFISKNLY